MGTISATASSAVPAAAATVGYDTRTFGPALTMGQNWYGFSFYGNDPTESGAIQNANDSVTISGSGGDNTYNAQISTTSAGTAPSGWTGEAFGGGGYFQAVLSFTGIPSNSGGWPSFWANGIEAMSGESAPDNTEVDGMEFDTEWDGLSYGSGMHNWYGGAGAEVATSGNAPAMIPPGTDLSQPHTYGFLWVPATARTQGYAQWFFDGTQVGTTDYWNQYNPSLSPTANPYSVLDASHLALILGTGPDNPMTVYSVSVWQSSTVDDIIQGVPKPSSDMLILRMSEDAYKGDAQFTVSVNGKQVGGIMETSALHGTADSNIFTLTGTWGANASVQIQFINDLYGGTAHDRNLYVDSVTYDGSTYTGATLYSNGSATFLAGGGSTSSAPADTLTLHLAQDAYEGNADFQLTIDGKHITNPQEVVASYTAGAWEDLTFAGNFGKGAHTIAVTFTNDAYGGTATTDRNLYVNGIDVNGIHYGTGVTSLWFTGDTALYTVTTTH